MGLVVRAYRKVMRAQQREPGSDEERWQHPGEASLAFTPSEDYHFSFFEQSDWLAATRLSRSPGGLPFLSTFSNTAEGSDLLPDDRRVCCHDAPRFVTRGTTVGSPDRRSRANRET
jgi:hypothetical protein